MKISTTAMMGTAALALTMIASGAGATPSDAPLALAKLPKLAKVDNRFQSYNIEMVEITGGRFWAPYGGPAGEMYRMRPPLDMKAPRLRHLAQALAPAYVRYSGTWSINSYLPKAGEVITSPPEGYKQVLTRDQWRGAVAFAKAVNAPIVTSFAASMGTRDAGGVWQVEQAKRLAALTKEAGGTIAAAEFFNEPNLLATETFAPDYDAKSYARDYAIFHAWAKKSLPSMKILGPGGVSEGGMLKDAASHPVMGGHRFIKSADMMKLSKAGFDATAYHHYGAVSPRCEGGKDPSNALSAKWLSLTEREYAFYADLRDKYAPGKDIWLTETAQAACGGSPWASTFRDTFRYLNQLGILAQKGVKVVMHNTLAASDYALVDYDTMMPRPNYWVAVLWARLMGPTVLASPQTGLTDTRIYAHCMRGKAGGVALLALNLGTADQVISPGKSASAYVVTAKTLDDRVVNINGAAPNMGDDGRITGIDAKLLGLHGKLTLPAQSVAFVAVPNAGNAACGAKG